MIEQGYITRRISRQRPHAYWRGGTSKLIRSVIAIIFSLGCVILPNDAALAKSRGTIIVVPTKAGGAYQQFLQAFRKSLARNGSTVAITVVASKDINAALFNPKKVRLVVAVGTAATQKVFDLNIALPVLGALLPRNSYRALEVRARKQGKTYARSAIFLDQPIARHIGLIRKILPNRKTLGVVLGPDTRFLRTELVAAAKKGGLRIRIETMGYAQHLIGPLNRALEDSGAFIAVADNVVSNRKTVQNLLLTTYRHRIPVIGYSRAYVRAGALAAVYSTPEQIGKQAGELVGDIVKGSRWVLPPSRYPKYFSVELNHDVARSLGILLPKQKDIENSLRLTSGGGK